MNYKFFANVRYQQQHRQFMYSQLVFTFNLICSKRIFVNFLSVWFSNQWRHEGTKWRTGTRIAERMSLVLWWISLLALICRVCMCVWVFVCQCICVREWFNLNKFKVYWHTHTYEHTHKLYIIALDKEDPPMSMAGMAVLHNPWCAYAIAVMDNTHTLYEA